jgi:chemotaxis protein CheY-P-specific phosphatase CheC
MIKEICNIEPEKALQTLNTLLENEIYISELKENQICDAYKPPI